MTSDGDENSSQWALATRHGPACFLAAGAEPQKGQAIPAPQPSTHVFIVLEKLERLVYS